MKVEHIALHLCHPHAEWIRWPSWAEFDAEVAKIATDVYNKLYDSE